MQFRSWRISAIEHLEARTVLQASSIGILLLDHSTLGALYSSGTGGVHVTGGGSLVIDSINSKAGIDVGKGNISADDFDITGGITATGGGKFLGTVVHQTATADPLAGLPVPPITTPMHSAVNVAGNASITLSPGTYLGGIHISGNASVTLLPGVYNLQGGGLSVRDNGKLTGTGVTIYNGAKKPTDEIFFGGNANVMLTAPESGTYDNIVIFQNRNSAAQIIVTGGKIYLVGVVYAAKSTLYFASSQDLDIGGEVVQEGIASELIIKDLIRSGSGNINVDVNNNNVADLAISITDDDGGSSNGDVGEAEPDDSITYTITVVNNGPAAVTGAIVNDAFLSPIDDDSYMAVGSAGTSGFTNSSTGTINDTVNMATGSTITYTVRADIDDEASGTLSNTATITGPISPADPDLSNNTATDSDTLGEQNT